MILAGWPLPVPLAREQEIEAEEDRVEQAAFDAARERPSCQSCGRLFANGEPGWVEDVKVIEPGGVRLVARYTCDDCEAR